MSTKILGIVTTILGAITAGLAFLPYGWADIAVRSLAGVLTVLSGGNVAMVVRSAKN
jgi:hypothetical protein